MEGFCFCFLPINMEVSLLALPFDAAAARERGGMDRVCDGVGEVGGGKVIA